MTAFARYWLPPLAWMALIWGLSTEIGSAERTGELLLPLVRLLLPWATPTQIDVIHRLLRKLGHLAEYGILAALWFRALNVAARVRPSASAWAALALSVTWAGLDELHQATVPSRNASAIDVAIDAAGATLAALACRVRRGVPRSLAPTSLARASGQREDRRKEAQPSTEA